MLGLLLTSGGVSTLEETLSEGTTAVIATPTAIISTYNGIMKTGIQWGTVVYYAVGILFVLLLAYIVYNMVKRAKAKVKK